MLPVEKISRPACLAGQSNGQLDPALLWSTPGLAGGPTVRLVAPAARSWRAMSAAASAAGHTLKATSSADSYRTLAQQTATFRARYTQTYLAGRPYRLWDSDGDGVKERWYQRPDTAVAAVPGTSNHGWGLAVDTGEEIDGDAGTESLDDATLDWLLAHAWDYGWSWEVQSERWHIRYCTGDAIPVAVLGYEEAQADMTFDYNDKAKLTAIFDAKRTVTLDTDSTPDGKGTLADFPVPLLVEADQRHAELRAKLDQILALLQHNGGGAGPSLDQIETVVRDVVADLAEGGSAAVRADT